MTSVVNETTENKTTDKKALLYSRGFPGSTSGKEPTS